MKLKLKNILRELNWVLLSADTRLYLQSLVASLVFLSCVVLILRSLLVSEFDPRGGPGSLLCGFPPTVQKHGLTVNLNVL